MQSQSRRKKQNLVRRVFGAWFFFKRIYLVSSWDSKAPQTSKGGSGATPSPCPPARRRPPRRMTRRPGALGWPGVRRSGLAHSPARPPCRAVGPAAAAASGGPPRPHACSTHARPTRLESPARLPSPAALPARNTHARPTRPGALLPPASRGLGASRAFLLLRFSRAAERGRRSPRAVLNYSSAGRY